ncbi:MAG: hypothetical protein R2712_25345 [Vicinamibacterales bacterium]
MTRRDDERHTWGSEKWVIEQLISAVQEGDAELKRRCARRWLDGFASHDWRAARFVDWGLFHPIREPDPRDYDPDDVTDLLQGCSEREFTARRLDAIRMGAPLRSDEKKLWRQQLVERAFDDETAYYGNCREWVILRFSLGASDCSRRSDRLDRRRGRHLRRSVSDSGRSTERYQEHRLRQPS